MINKKASMELGINTVVVLVIAMVIIAGGIAFIRGFFQKGTDKLGSAFNVGDFGVQPTTVDPLVLVEGSPSIKGGERQSVKVGFYNRGTTPAENVKIYFSECVSTAVNDNCKDPENPLPIMTSLGQTVDPGQSAGFQTFVTASCLTNSDKKQSLLPGDYICSLKAYDSNNKIVAETQVTLTVTG